MIYIVEENIFVDFVYSSVPNCRGEGGGRGGGGQIAHFGKTPQVHLIIIKE